MLSAFSYACWVYLCLYTCLHFYLVRFCKPYTMSGIREWIKNGIKRDGVLSCSIVTARYVEVFCP